MNARERQHAKGKRFVELHARAGAFVIPNPWDAGTARDLARAAIAGAASR